MRRHLLALALCLLSVHCAHRQAAPMTAHSPGGRSDWDPERHAPQPADPPGPTESRTAIPLGVNQVNIPLHPIGNGSSEDETTIVVNPNNKLNVVAGTRVTLASGGGAIAAYSSLDGGQTWQGGVFNDNTYNFEADPVLAFCRNGAVYQVLVAADSLAGASALLVRRSADGGQTWPIVRTAFSSPGTPFLDKPWMVCDTTTSPYSNRLYLQWMELGEQLGDQRIKISWSDDSGLTWATPVTISDQVIAQNQGALDVGPGGELYLAWNVVQPDGSLVLASDRSLDGGATWGTDQIIDVAEAIPVDGPVARLTYPTLSVDRSGRRFNGTVYVAWADDRFGDPDILLSRSTDGVNWSEPIRVNDDPLGNGADQYNQSIAVDPKGRVIVTFWDRRRYAGGSRYEIWGAISRDGGQSFDTNFVISDIPSDRALNNFLGDYVSTAASEDFIWPLWTDSRAGIPFDGDLFTDAYPNVFDYNEIRNVLWTDNNTMDFERQDLVFSQNLDYDVISGILNELRADGGFDRVSCSSAAWSAPPFIDPRLPLSGFGKYYLVRARGPYGVGTYGDGSPKARLGNRDILDEAAVCP